MLIGRGRALWGLGAVYGLLFATGLVMSLFQPTRFVGGYFVFAALVLSPLTAWFVFTAKSTGTPPAALVVVVLAYSALLVLPVVLVSLATSGSTSGFAYLWRPGHGHRGYLGTQLVVLAGGPLFLVPILLIVLPEVLRRQVECGPAPVARAMDGQADGVARIKRLLPSWLAAGAALSTGLYAFTLHFLGGPPRQAIAAPTNRGDRVRGTAPCAPLQVRSESMLGAGDCGGIRPCALAQGMAEDEGRSGRCLPIPRDSS